MKGLRTLLKVFRQDVLAYRIAVHELHRVDANPSELAVLDLGVQDTPHGSARLALAARTTQSLDDPELTLVWSIRGAPHLHRLADLPALTAALWPLSDADATSRISTTNIKEGARLGLAAFAQTAQAFRDVVREPMPKGQVSTGVSALVDRSLTYDCGPCNARHISGALFQQTGLPGAVRLELSGSSTMLVPLSDPPPIPMMSTGAEALASAYLRLHGPATAAEAAKFLGTTRTHLGRVWPDGLAEVEVDGRRAWLPADRLDMLRDPPSPAFVRLLPPADPYLQARDRALLVPDKERQSAVWRILGNPGALLVNGEIVGTWRSRISGGKLRVTIAAFESLSAKARQAAVEEAAHVAAARGTGAATVTFED